MHKIRFLPDDKLVEVEAGITLMQAAEKAGVYINNLCGGKGVCGRCRVQVTGGRIRADKHSLNFLSKEEITDGYVLACQTTIDSDIDVLIPPESRLEEAQILLESSPVQYGAPEKIVVPRLDQDRASLFAPLVRKIFLEIKAPSLEDNVSDVDRIVRELRKKTGDTSFEIPLSCLRGLARKLRQHEWKVTATIARDNHTWRILQIEAGDTSESNYGLAVDVGTTTVVTQLIHLKTGNVIGVAGSHNMQSRYGEDVISRMIYACGREEGLDPLHAAVVQNINQLIQTLIKERNIQAREIQALVAAGNTTMSHLLLGLIPCSIRLDPYVPTANTYPQTTAGDLALDMHPRGIVETLPGVASYVGGDIVAGILACGIADGPKTKVLIDVGTNGEIALGNNEWLVCCSASAGPAFEGGGIRHGMRATRGAIENVNIENGRVQYSTIGDAKPRGICGSGLIDLLYELSINHLIDGEGKFRLDRNHGNMVEEDGEALFILARPEETETEKPLAIWQSDIDHLIRSKGAVFAAIKSLIDYIGLTFEDIDTFFIAGGFGNYLDIKKATGIGLIPDIDADKIRFVGNSSLMGARMCLISSHAAERAEQIAKSTTNIELSNYQPFMDEYVAAMFLPHTDRKLFPSINY